MADGFIVRKGGVAVEQTTAPSINFVSKTDSEIVVTFTNNDAAEAEVFFGITSTLTDTVTLAAAATSSNITFSGLDDDTTFTVSAFALVTDPTSKKIKSEIVTSTITTDEALEFYLSFDGVDDFVSLNNLQTSGFGATELNDVTFEMKFESDTLANTTRIFMGTLNNNDGTGIRYSDNLTSGGVVRDIELFIRDATNTTLTGEILSLISGVNTYGLRYRNNEITFFINGNEVTQSRSGGVSPTNFSDFEFPLVLGALNNRGTIIAFSQIELYDFKIFTGNTLFLHYDFSEGTGTTLFDKVGNNNATITGATWVQL